MSVVVAPPRIPLPRGTADEVRHGDDPVGWIAERLKEKLWAKQREIADALVEQGHVAVPSCHSSGKSFIASRLACWWLDVHPIGSARVITTAPTQHQVKTVLWGEIAAAKMRGGLDGYITRGQVPEWTVGGRVVAFGRKPQDIGTPEQAMQAFQGIHAEYVLILLDEAGGIPKWLFDAAETLATGEHDRILAIGNPDDPTAHFAEVCKPGSGWTVIPISALDTPRFTGEAIDERIPLISKKWVEERGKRWGVDSPLYRSKVLGEFPDLSDDAVCQVGQVVKAQQRELDLSETPMPIVIGCDVARFGSDETVIAARHGGQVRIVRSYIGRDLMQTVGQILAAARELAASTDTPKEFMQVVVDDVGVGGGVTDRLREIGEFPVVGFNGGNQAYTSDYPNRRSELWFAFSEQLPEIDLDPDDQLAADLIAPKYAFDSHGRRVVEAKSETKKRLGRSPDRADAVLLTFAAPPMVAPVAASTPRQRFDVSRSAYQIRKEM